MSISNFYFTKISLAIPRSSMAALKDRALGHSKLKITREEIIEAGETVFREFNRRQVANPTIRNCFTSCGQNIFDDNLTPY